MSSKKRNTVLIGNQKGGPGKTTLTFHIAYFLGQAQKKVLLLDLDGQGSLTSLLGYDPDEIEKPVGDLLISKKPNTREYIVQTKLKNVDAILSNQSTFAAERHMNTIAGREFLVTDLIEQVKDQYDVIFLDVPPSVSNITFNAVVSANHIIFVHQVSKLDRNGIAQMLDVLDEVRAKSRLNINNPKVLGSIFNRYQKVNKIMNQTALDELVSVNDVIPRQFQHIMQTTEFDKAQEANLPIGLFNPNHESVSQFKKLSQEIYSCLA